MKLVIKNLLFGLCFLLNSELMAQDTKSVPAFYEIPPYPGQYTAATVAARMIDGLGFRYYWATDGLREQDLNFRPNAEARTSLETISHIYELSIIIVRTVKKEPNIRGGDTAPAGFEELRRLTLENLKIASDILKTGKEPGMEQFKIVFKTENDSTEFPFWNLLNGPIADVLWHVGQVVSFRRSSGNPFNSKVNVFTGKLED